MTIIDHKVIIGIEVTVEIGKGVTVTTRREVIEEGLTDREEVLEGEETAGEKMPQGVMKNCVKAITIGIEKMTTKKTRTSIPHDSGRITRLE